jgi:ferredoxin
MTKYPYAILHSQVCDKYEDCPAAKHCPQKAIISYPQNEFGINIEKCNGCALCQKYCNLFWVVNNELDLYNFKSWIKNDPRNEQILRVERFSADIVDENWSKIELVDVQIFLEKHKNYPDDITVIEIINPQNAVCLYQTIPVAEIIGGRRFKKMRSNDLKELPSNWNITMLPVIIIFKGNRILGKYEGRIEVSNMSDLEDKKKWLYDYLNNIIKGGNTGA